MLAQGPRVRHVVADEVASLKSGRGEPQGQITRPCQEIATFIRAETVRDGVDEIQSDVPGDEIKL